MSCDPEEKDVNGHLVADTDVPIFNDELAV